MNEMWILCVEDEVEVRDALVRDIAPFAAVARIEEAEDATEAEELVAQCLADGDDLALVLCDHRLPGESGVDFLVKLNAHDATDLTRKVLVTGQAGLEDTVKAINQADLDYYIAKPWTVASLQQIVRDQLTTYVLQTHDDLKPFVATLDGARLLEAMRASDDYE